MPEIYWPTSGNQPGTGSGYQLAQVSGSGGHFDATPFETLSSYRTEGFFFFVGRPSFPVYDGILDPIFYAHGAGFWISVPSSDAYHIDEVPDDALWNFRDFSFWKLAQTDPPFPTPNDYQPTFLAGQWGIVRNDYNNLPADVDFGGVTLPGGNALFYTQGTDANPFDGSAPGAAKVGYANPQNPRNRQTGTNLPLSQATKVQFVAAQVYGSSHIAYRTGRNGQEYPYTAYDHLDFWHPDTLYYLYKVITDPDDTGDGAPADTGGDNGVDMLNHWTGLFIAYPGAGMNVLRARTAFQPFESKSVIDTDATSAYPTLFVQESGEAIGCFYRRGKGTAASPYQYVYRVSYDRGVTWARNVDKDGREMALLTGKKWARMVPLGDGKRKRGHALIYNDASGRGTDGNANGKGLLQCALYAPDGSFVGVFPDDGKGIAGKLADDAGMGVEYINDADHDVRVTFFSGGALVYAVSVNEGRGWVDITAQLQSQ